MIGPSSGDLPTTKETLLVVDLEDYLEVPLADLPERLRERIQRANLQWFWDKLDAPARRYQAQLFDAQGDYIARLGFELWTLHDELTSRTRSLRERSETNPAAAMAALELGGVCERLAQLVETDPTHLGVTSQDAATVNTYTTPLLKILRGAIRKFCLTASDTYPKKDEVVAWITHQSADGQLVAKDLADRMESVIAPRAYANHRGKKSRPSKR